jgi:hypothetical protein
MRTARMLESEWGQVLQGSVSTREKEDELNIGLVWAAGFHQIMARSRLAGILKLTNSLILYFSIFLGSREPRILNQWIRGHTCI